MDGATVGAPAIATSSSVVVLPFFNAANDALVVVVDVVTFNSRQEIIIRIKCN